MIWIVEMCRISEVTAHLEIEAANPDEAARKAYEVCEDHEYPEKEAEYEIQSIHKKKK